MIDLRLMRLAKDGDVDAMSSVGSEILFGDYPEGLRDVGSDYLERASSKGDLHSQFALSILTIDGRYNGMTKSDAVSILEKLFEMGYEDKMLGLPEYHLIGIHDSGKSAISDDILERARLSLVKKGSDTELIKDIEQRIDDIDDDTKERMFRLIEKGDEEATYLLSLMIDYIPGSKNNLKMLEK